MSAGFASGMTRTVAKRFYNAARVLVGPPLFARPGHFYSPIVDTEGVRGLAFPDRATEFAMPEAIEIDREEMLAFWKASEPFRATLELRERPSEGFRYYCRNDYFGRGDALVLAAMLERFAPRRIIEVGGGFSTACMLDVIDRHFAGAPELTVIEPNPDRLLERLFAADRQRIRLISDRVQAVDPGVFDRLEAGDVLFVDSSHVVKTGSDVGTIVFDILPRLKPGVLVHFHDIFFPFEYLSRWVLQDNRSWNEAYLLRAFLMYNREFKVVFFNDYFRRLPMPGAPGDGPLGGGSLWLCKNGGLQ